MVRTFNVLGLTTTLTGHRLYRGEVARRGLYTVGSTYRRIVSNYLSSRFPLIIFRANSNARSGVGTGRIVTGHNGRVSNGGLLRPGSSIGVSRSSGSAFPATVRVTTIVSMGRGLVPTVGKLVRVFGALRGRGHDVVGANHARLRSTAPVEFSSRVSN